MSFLQGGEREAKALATETFLISNPAAIKLAGQREKKYSTSFHKEAQNCQERSLS